MKLSEMSGISNKRQQKFMESRFGFSIDFNQLSITKAKKLHTTISENLNLIRRSVSLHTAEQNPRYMELLTIRESLNSWLSEQRVLTEGEVGTAEVLLAAKDMVDSVQDIIEKVGKMQNEQLPQLLDSIRDQVGSAEAEAFKSSVGSSLSTLMTQLSAAREGVDGGVRVLSGEQLDNPMDLGNGTGGELPTDINPVGDIGDGSELGDTDGFGATDAATGGPTHLGRELRENRKPKANKHAN